MLGIVVFQTGQLLSSLSCDCWLLDFYLLSLCFLVVIVVSYEPDIYYPDKRFSKRVVKPQHSRKWFWRVPRH